MSRVDILLNELDSSLNDIIDEVFSFLIGGLFDPILNWSIQPPPTPATIKRKQESGPTAFAISFNPWMSGLGTQRRTYLKFLKPET